MELETRGFYLADRLEVREDGREITGQFPYAKRAGEGPMAVVADRGPNRKEQFAPHAFRYAIEDETREIQLLFGHNPNTPLARRNNGTFELEDTDDALRFRAVLPPLNEQPSYMRDVLMQIRAGLIPGVSPGFRIPPAAAVANAVEMIDEPGNPGVKIRWITAAVLYELSLVSRPAYEGDDNTVDVRTAIGSQTVSLPRRYWL
ncbi:MAG: HK97 family phage prohead protease [Gammaproteobacteria bacterium]|nr:HK97 family phage prohead protease [Gammaproteobacteria bacterium]